VTGNLFAVGRASARAGLQPRSPQEAAKDRTNQQNAAEEQTQFIHIVTDDPDVVILWALNTKGETR
jgi:hypothetical protein